MKRVYLVALVFLSALNLNSKAQNLDLAWAKKMGGGAADGGLGIQTDAAGNVYTTGFFNGTADFDPGPATFNMTSFGSNDVFISKLDPSGNFIWAKQIGGTDNDIGFSITIDNVGNIIIAGSFKGTADFDAGPGSYAMTSAGDFDYFVSKFNATGNFIWAKQIGNINQEYQDYIGSDLSGNIYLNGKFTGTVDFDPGPAIYNLTSTSPPSLNVFVLKLDASGNFLWANQFTGNQTISSSYLVSSNGDNYILGQFGGTVDFDPGPAVYNLTAMINSADIFITKLDALGNFAWAKQLAGSTIGTSGGTTSGLEVGGNGSIYATGNFKGTMDFDPGPSVFNLTSSTGNETFILKLDLNGDFSWAKHIPTIQGTFSSGQIAYRAISADVSGNVYAFGSFVNTVDFDPGSSIYNLTSYGGWDMFILTLDNAGNFISAKQQGGASDDLAYALKAISNGNLIATGNFSAVADFDPCPGTYNLSSSGSVDIFVEKFASPSVTIAATSIAICSGTSVTFTATPTNGGSTPFYQWQVNGVNVGTNSPTYTTATLNNNDQVSVILTSNATCVPPTIAASNIITVTVGASISTSVSISTPATTVCQGTSVTFTATPTNGGATPIYQWQVNGGNVGTNSPMYTTSTLLNGDVVKVIMTSSAACATPPVASSNTITMTISPGGSAQVIISSTGSTICVGGSVTFTATPTNGGPTASYQWQVNGGNVGINSTSYTTNTLVNGDVIRVIMTSSLSCATGSPATSNTITMTVSSGGAATVNISSPSTTICSGTSLTFTATPTNGGSTPTYQWQVNGSNVGANSPTYTTSTLSNGDIVKVIMTSNLSCATGSPATSNSIVMSVTQSLTPSVDIAVSATTICVGTSVNFTAIPTNGGTSPGYQWQVNGINVGTNSPLYTTSILNNGDLVRCILTSNYVCVTATTATSNTIQMTVNAPVIPSVSIAASVTTICTGALVTFTATPVNGGTTPSYQWKLNGSNVGTNSPAYSTNSLVNGDVISCVLTNLNSCSPTTTAASNNIAMIVTTTIVPSLTITSTANNICPDASVTFTAVPVNVGTTPSYQWQLNGTNVGGNNLTYSNNSFTNGDKINCIMNTVTSCSATPLVYSDTITMIVKPKPVISFSPSNPTIPLGSSIQLNAIVTGNLASYLWTPSTGLNNPTVLNPIASPVATTTYNLNVIATNSCSADKQLTVTVFKDIYIPNSFTPNGDGLNDIFRIPPGTSLNLQYFIIYDRYGNEIFITADVNKGWDGTYKAAKSPNGAYTYLIKGSDSKGEIILNGTVLIIR